MEYKEKKSKSYNNMTGQSVEVNLLFVNTKENETLKDEMNKINWTINGKKYKIVNNIIPFKKTKSPIFHLLIEE